MRHVTVKILSVTDLFAPTIFGIFGLNPGATEREMDWWDQRGGSQVGDVTLLHWPWSLDPALQFASQNEQSIGLFSLFCIILYPFLAFSSWHR